MTKKTSKYKEDYSLRTLAYYQRKGGIYNELITILQRIRVKRGYGRILAPNKILNAATAAFDLYIDECRDEDTGIINDCGIDEMAIEIYGGCIAGPLGELEKKDEIVALSVLCALLSQYPEFNDTSVPEISEIVKERAPLIFEEFSDLIWKNINRQDYDLQSLRLQLAAKDSVINIKDAQIDELINQKTELEKEIADLKNLRKFCEVARIANTDFNQALNLNSILGWVANRKHYKLADQVISMLKDLGRKTATDEECKQIAKIEDELLENFTEQSVINNNMGIGSNFLTGLAKNPLMPIGMGPDQLAQKIIEFINNNGTRRESKD